MLTNEKFTKPFIKARDLQERIAASLTADPTINNIDVAEQNYDWFIALDRPRQIEILSYAISHLRQNVEEKLKPKAPSYKSQALRAASEAQAARILLKFRASVLMSLTFEQIEGTLAIGPALKTKMTPGQKVRDVWKQNQIEKLLRNT